MIDDFEPATAVLVALVELRAMPPGAWTEGTTLDLAIRLDRVSSLQALLAAARAEIETDLADRMEADEIPVPGVGVLKRTPAKREAWRFAHSSDQMREDLALAVASAVALDVASGELDQMKRNVALAAVRAAYEVIPSFSSLKTAGRKRFNLRLEDYRTSDEYYKVALEVPGEP